MISIQDNFLTKQKLLLLQSSLPYIQWKTTACVPDAQRSCDKIDNIQFVHEFYSNFQPQTDQFELLLPLLIKLQPSALIRIKLNLITRTHEIIEHGFHVDHPYPNAKTSIFYLNTCNGYTLFEDGTKVECLQNRLVTFNSDIKHSGSSCTDKPSKMLINFNYF